MGIYFAGRGLVHTFKAWCEEEQLFFFTWIGDAAVVEGCGHRQSCNNKYGAWKLRFTAIMLHVI